MESFHATTIVSVRRDGRIVIGGDAGAFTDPDGYVWETVAP